MQNLGLSLFEDIRPKHESKSGLALKAIIPMSLAPWARAIIPMSLASKCIK